MSHSGAMVKVKSAIMWVRVRVRERLDELSTIEFSFKLTAKGTDYTINFDGS